MGRKRGPKCVCGPHNDPCSFCIERAVQGIEFMLPTSKPTSTFIQQAKAKTSWSRGDFLQFCSQAAVIAESFPADKATLAYWIVSFGSHLSDIDVRNATDRSDGIQRRIRNLAADLELPDELVYAGDGLSVEQKWRLIKTLSGEGLALEAKT